MTTGRIDPVADLCSLYLELFCIHGLATPTLFILWPRQWNLLQVMKVVEIEGKLCLQGLVCMFTMCERTMWASACASWWGLPARIYIRTCINVWDACACMGMWVLCVFRRVLSDGVCVYTCLCCVLTRECLRWMLPSACPPSVASIRYFPELIALFCSLTEIGWSRGWKCNIVLYWVFRVL